MLGRACRRLRGAALLLVLLIVGVSVGKVMQYAAVEHFGARLGFDLASAIGLAPFFAIMVYLAIRFPRNRRG